MHRRDFNLIASRQRELETAAASAGCLLSIQEATRITTEAVTAPISVGHGDSVEDALFDLERALKAL